jgi:hypothetical protein
MELRDKAKKPLKKPCASGRKSFMVLRVC